MHRVSRVGLARRVHAHACTCPVRPLCELTPRPHANQVDDIHPFYSDLLNVLYDKVTFPLATAYVLRAEGSSTHFQSSSPPNHCVRPVR